MIWFARNNRQVLRQGVAKRLQMALDALIATDCTDDWQTEKVAFLVKLEASL